MIAAVRFCCALAALVLLAGAPASAQRTVKLIVPSAAGGGADVLARLLADQIGRTQKQTIVVENRPGGGNVIATEAVARAAPDGSTVLITTPEFVINSHLRKLSYDPLTSFAPVCTLARSPQLFVVPTASPYRSLRDLVDAARAKPNEISIASAGPASSPHVAIERIKHEAKVAITYVPYPGSGPAINALMGQHVTAAVASFPNVAAAVRAGQLRALAAGSATRVPDLPDVTTVEEAGFKGFDFDIWFGTAAPAGTPAAAIAEVSGWLTKALADPELTAKFPALGLYPVGVCGDASLAYTRSQYEAYGRAIRDSGIRDK